AERVDAQWKKLQAELQQLEGPLRESIKPAVALCRAHDLQSALSELLRASWEGDGVAHQRAAQSRIRMLRDALRRIGFRNRWIDAISSLTAAHPSQLHSLASQARDSDSLLDFELIDARNEKSS